MIPGCSRRFSERLSVTALAALTWAGAARAQTQAEQIPARRITDLAQAGSKTFAATMAGIFISGDAGRHWDKDAGIQDEVDRLAVSGGKLYAAGSGFLLGFDDTAGVFRPIRRDLTNAVGNLVAMGGSLYSSAWGEVSQSRDGGRTWLKKQTIIAGLFAGPGGRLFSVDNNLESFISQDGGRSWSAADSAYPRYAVSQAVFSADGRRVFCAAPGNPIIRFPGPKTLPVPDGAQGLPCLAVIGSRLLAGFSAGGLLRSDDDGESFHPAGQGLGGDGVSELAAGSTSVFARTGKGVFRSVDSGQSFQLILPGNLADTGLIVRGTEVLAAADGNLHHSANDGSDWTALAGSGKTFGGGSQLVLIAGGLLYRGRDGSLEITSDLGKSWRPFAARFGDFPAGKLAAADNRIYLRTGPDLDFSHENLVVSQDTGRTWNDASSGLPSDVLTATASLSVDIFAGSAVGVYRSVNGGEDWMPCNQGLGAAPSVSALAASGDTLFAATQQDQGVYVSADRGASWRPLRDTATGVSAPYPLCLLSVPGGLLAGTSRGLLMRYDFASGHWIRAGASPSGFSVTSLLALPGRLLAGTDGDGPLASEDGGKSWTSTGLAVSRPRGSGNNEPGSLEVTLDRAGPETILRYRVFQACRLNLDLVTPTGRRISVIANRRVEAGSHVAPLEGGLRGAAAYILKIVPDGGFPALTQTGSLRP